MKPGADEFPSTQTYGGQLRAHPVAQRLRVILCARRPGAAPVDTAGKGFEESRAPGTQSLRNEGEAELIIARARALLAAGIHPEQLA